LVLVFTKVNVGNFWIRRDKCLRDDKCFCKTGDSKLEGQDDKCFRFSCVLASLDLSFFVLPAADSFWRQMFSRLTRHFESLSDLTLVQQMFSFFVRPGFAGLIVFRPACSRQLLATNVFSKLAGTSRASVT
jgi:hypothetical protein